MPRTKKTSRELELEQEVKTLKRELALAKDKRITTKLKRILRTIGVWLFVMICAISLNFSIAAGWLKQNIVDTKVWTSKTSQMLADPDIRSDISKQITDQIFQAADVQSIVSEVVPPRAAALAVPLTNSLQSHTESRVNTILASERFQTFWQNLNTSAHAGIISSLENGGTTPPNSEQYVIYINNSQLLLNLKPIVKQVQSQLTDRGLSFVSSINTDRINKTIPLTDIKSLPQVLAVFNVLNKSFRILIGLALTAGVLALLLAQNKRKVLIAITLSTIGLMVLNVQLIYLAKFPLTSQLATSLNTSGSNSAQAMFNILTKDLVYYDRVLMLIALIVFLAAVLSGPSRFAKFIRHQLSSLTKHRDSKLLNHFATNTTAYIGLLGGITAVMIVFNPTSSLTLPLITLIVSCLLSVWLIAIKQTPKS